MVNQTCRLFDNQIHQLEKSGRYQKFRSLVSLIQINCIFVITGNEMLRYRLVGMLEQNTPSRIIELKTGESLDKFLIECSTSLVETQIIVRSNLSCGELPNKKLMDFSKPIVFVNMENPLFIEEINTI